MLVELGHRFLHRSTCACSDTFGVTSPNSAVNPGRTVRSGHPASRAIAVATSGPFHGNRSIRTGAHLESIWPSCPGPGSSIGPIESPFGASPSTSPPPIGRSHGPRQGLSMALEIESMIKMEVDQCLNGISMPRSSRIPVDPAEHHPQQIPAFDSMARGHRPSYASQRGDDPRSHRCESGPMIRSKVGVSIDVPRAPVVRSDDPASHLHRTPVRCS